MALSQTITNEQGAKTTYHRVAKAELDFNKKSAEITIYSYATQALRKAEKEEAETQAQRDELMNELNELVADPTDENEDRRKELTEQINKIPVVNEPTPRHLVETTHTIELTSDDFTLKDVYVWLKDSIYTDAKDAQLSD
jgi:predicted transcriptional regulator